MNFTLEVFLYFESFFSFFCQFMNEGLHFLFYCLYFRLNTLAQKLTVILFGSTFFPRRMANGELSSCEMIVIKMLQILIVICQFQKNKRLQYLIAFYNAKIFCVTLIAILMFLIIFQELFALNYCEVRGILRESRASSEKSCLTLKFYVILVSHERSIFLATVYNCNFNFIIIIIFLLLYFKIR